MDPLDLGRQLSHAGSLCDLGRFDEAVNRLGVLLAHDSDNLRAVMLLSQALIGRGDASAALEQAERAVTLAPDDEWPHRLASIASRALGHRDDAVRHAETAVQLAPLGHAPYLTLVQALVMPQSRFSGQHRPDLERAKSAALEAVKLAPHDARSHLVLGIALGAAGDHAGAEAAYRRTLEIDPENSAALNNLARERLPYEVRTPLGALSKPGVLADAAEGFADALAANPNSELARRNLDHVARTFLRALAWLIFFDAFFARFTSRSPSAGVRLVPLLPLALLAVTVVRYLRRLSPALRGHLGGVLRREGATSASAGCLGLAALALVAACGAPAGARSALTAIGALLAGFGYLLLALHTKRRAPLRHNRSRYLLSSTALMVIAAGFAVLGAAGISIAHRGAEHLAAGRGTAIIGFGVALAIVLNLARRYRAAR
jgi:tetratricopeptide (TPR) repeat protein